MVRKYKPNIVAVTGSVGKTSTKDAIFAVLAESHHVRKSNKSFNSEIGLPLTILGCPNAWNNPLRWLQNIFDGLLLLVLPARYPEWLVLEVGADRPGDIRGMAKWLPVDVAVITRLPEVPVHVEFFDSPEAVVEEKASLINAVKPTGTVVLYGDDRRIDLLRERAAARSLAVQTFGLTPGSGVRGVDVEFIQEEGAAGARPIGMRMQVEVDGGFAPLSVVGVLGAHALLPLLAAAAVGRVLGSNTQDIIAALGHYDPPPGRMRVLPGIKDTTLIDDSYNSSPAAVSAALETLRELKTHFPSGRHVVALGDMLELGRHSVDEHRRVGVQVAAAVDVLVTVGFRARDIAEAALDRGLPDHAIFQYEDAEKAGEELAAMLHPGDVVLVKGSQSMRMERVAEHCMKEPERAEELLVRQDVDWKKR